MADEDLVQEGKKGGKLKWIIIAVALIVLGVGGYFGYTMFLAAPDDVQTAESGAGGEGGSAATESLEGKLVPLPMFLVNLADPWDVGISKLGLEVEVRDNKAEQDLLKYEAKIKDTLLMLLSSKTYDSLSTMKAKVELKQEIADRLNQIVGKGAILRVYITEMVIQ